AFLNITSTAVPVRRPLLLAIRSSPDRALLPVTRATALILRLRPSTSRHARGIVTQHAGVSRAKRSRPLEIARRTYDICRLTDVGLPQKLLAKNVAPLIDAHLNGARDVGRASENSWPHVERLYRSAYPGREESGLDARVHGESPISNE